MGNPEHTVSTSDEPFLGTRQIWQAEYQTAPIFTKKFVISLYQFDQNGQNCPTWNLRNPDQWTIFFIGYQIWHAAYQATVIFTSESE